MTSSEGFYAEKMQELQKQLNSLKKAINTNSKERRLLQDEGPYVTATRRNSMKKGLQREVEHLQHVVEPSQAFPQEQGVKVFHQTMESKLKQTKRPLQCEFLHKKINHPLEHLWQILIGESSQVLPPVCGSV